MLSMTKANDLKRGKCLKKSSVLLQENDKLCVMDMSKLSVEEEWTQIDPNMNLTMVISHGNFTQKIEAILYISSSKCLNKQKSDN